MSKNKINKYIKIYHNKLLYSYFNINKIPQIL